MKRVLKKSEIIDQLHRLLVARSLEVVCFSCIEITDFYKSYCLLVKHHDFYQVIFVDLHFGWIEWFIQDTYKKLVDAKYGYLQGIKSHLDLINLTEL